MTDIQQPYDVIIIGGGPAGASLGSLLAMDGYRPIILEKDIHPRDHVGESITPSTNPIAWACTPLATAVSTAAWNARATGAPTTAVGLGVRFTPDLHSL